MKKFLLILVSLVLLVSLCSCAEVIDGILCDLLGVTNSHEHSFGEWETKTSATCESAEVEVRKCQCGEEETREGDAALGHTAVSISAVCNKTNAMQGEALSASDITVTATCSCDATFTVTEGVALENANLENVGENTVTVKFGDLSCEVIVVATKPSYVLNGTIVADTYVSSDAKNSNYIDRESMGTNSSNFRVFLKYNFSDILANDKFLNNKDNAKVQFTFTVVEEAYTDETAFTFGGFIPGAGVSDVDFSVITWNSVRTGGDYTGLDWGNAVYMIDQAVGSHHVSYADGVLTLTFTYGQIKDFIDEDGNAIFTLRAKQSKVKISSMEGTAAPTVSVIINDEHLHAFDEKVIDEKYFVSDNCGEETYYYKSCACGEAGVTMFKDGVVNEHSFGDWTVIDAATCTADGKKQRTCTLCTDGVEEEILPALGHEAGTEWLNDDSNHWNLCANGCGEVMNKSAHSGGNATETEQATCETCGVKYGGFADHVHAFTEWESISPATCDKDEVLYRKCNCGVEETKTGVAALGHDVQTKFDENNHWTECVHNCGLSTEAVAHFGGTATETEKATCEGCGQPYGELKVEEKEVTVNGAIVEDTYVTSDGGNGSKNFSDKTENNCNNAKNFRPLFKFNLANVLNDANFNKNTAKVSFTFGVSTGADLLTGESTKYNVYGFLPGEGVSDVDFTTVTWNTNKADGTYSKLYRKDTNENCVFLTQNTLYADLAIEVSITEVDGKTYITYTLDYSAIEQLICTEAGDTYGYLVMGFDFNQTIKFASMENTNYAAPVVKVTYSK